MNNELMIHMDATVAKTFLLNQCAQSTQRLLCRLGNFFLGCEKRQPSVDLSTAVGDIYIPLISLFAIGVKYRLRSSIFVWPIIPATTRESS